MAMASSVGLSRNRAAMCMICCDGDLSHGHITTTTTNIKHALELAAVNWGRRSPLPALQRLQRHPQPCLALCLVICFLRPPPLFLHETYSIAPHPLCFFPSTPHLACLCCISFCPRLSSIHLDASGIAQEGKRLILTRIEPCLQVR